MSYILDALKKAERERGIAQVPTLSTVHDLRTKPQIRLWAACGIVVLCIAALMWFILFDLDADEEMTHSLAEGADNTANRPDLMQGKSAEPVDAPSLAIRSSESRMAPGFGYPDERPSYTDEAEIKRDDRRGPVPTADGRQAAQPSRAEIVSHAATAQSSGEHTSENIPYEVTEIPPPQRQRASARIEEPEPSAGATEEERASLRDAMEKMTMSILYYSENKAERLVFINGRRYVEGDTVEGHYLLESITPEGAVLTYNGDRAMLRPGNN